MIHPLCILLGHRWQTVIIRTPTGPRYLTRCARCGRTR